MTRHELIVFYRNILSSTSDISAAMSTISAHLDNIVSEGTNRRLTRTERFEILDEVFEDTLFRKSLPSLESLKEVRGSVNEADNSHILDVISALKRGAQK